MIRRPSLASTIALAAIPFAVLGTFGSSSWAQTIAWMSLPILVLEVIVFWGQR